MSDQTWKKVILAIYWLLWDGHSALIEIFITPTQPTLAVHRPAVLGKCSLQVTTDHDNDKRRGWEKVALFTFYLKSEHQPRIGKKVLIIEEYLHDFTTGAAAPVLSSGVGLPWSRVAEKCPLLLLQPSEEIRTEIRSFISKQQLRQKLLIYCLAWLFFLFNVYFSSFLGHLHRALGT